MSAGRILKFSEAKSTTRLRPIWPGAAVLALAAGLSLAGCSGAAGLNIPVAPVDHSCPIAYSCGGHR